MSQKEREQLHAEFSILHSLRHPNIVAYYNREHLKSTQDLHLYMEYCGGGDLSKVIEKLKINNQYAEEEFVWSIFSQLVTALFRCHYGVDPPEVGHNVMGSGNVFKPTGLKAKNSVMILHRDLKPENGTLLPTPPVWGVKLMVLVFLGADNSVKLGDFGLSKIMASHDFASTYVGTPFYMSPEICAAERYTLHSDIWSLGCIMYELCARVPPFNAKTHFHLIQKIKEGRVDPLPTLYSPELQNVIKSCLKTNPLNRPDTATLLNLPIVRLMRKEREVVALGKQLKSKEEQALQRAHEAEAMVSRLEAEKEKMKAEIESTVRREWEVKARLEIDRQIQSEMEKLHKKFDTEVQARVEMELQKHLRSLKAKDNISIPVTDIPSSSVSTSGDTDFPSTTDLSSLSIDSPLSSRSNRAPPKKATRTPFSRARTTYDSPMDVQMAEPSPMSIASLSLSPRRTAAAAASTLPTSNKNIFTAAAAQKAKWEPHLPTPSPSEDDENDNVDEEEEEGDSLPDLPSPTRPSSRALALARDPFKAPPSRPGLLRQKTAPMHRLNTQPPLFPSNAVAVAATKPFATHPAGVPALKQVATIPTATATTQAPTPAPDPAPAPKLTSPNRRLSKLPPSSSNTTTTTTLDAAGSPLRKGPRTPPRPKASKASAVAVGEDMFKAVMQRNLLVHGAGAGATGVGGRTLVELAQARAGGVAYGSGVGTGTGMSGKMGEEEVVVGEGGVRMAVRIVEREREAVLWDPERDEMPSPFLVRGGRGLRRL